MYFIIPKDRSYPWYFNISFLANVFFGMGILVGKYREKILPFLLSKKVGTVSLCIYILLVIIDATLIHQSGAFHTQFNNYPWFFVESIFGVITILFVSHKCLNKSRSLLFIGQNTLLFFLFQYRFFMFVGNVFSRIGIEEDLVFYGPLRTVLVIVIMSPIVWLISRYIPIMSGKYRIKLKTK